MTVSFKDLEVERVVPNALLKQIRACARLIWHWLGEKLIHLVWASIALVASVGCETANYAPVANKEMVAVSHRRDVDPSTSPKTSLAQLEHGRSLFVGRCIECHTLPPLWKYSREDWPKIVNDMSHRASLKPTERDAIVAYILAVRASER